MEGRSAVYCYECHEELLHNPVFTEQDIKLFAELVEAHGLNEDEKPETRDKLAGRIRLFHQVIHTGLQALAARTRAINPERHRTK